MRPGRACQISSLSLSAPRGASATLSTHVASTPTRGVKWVSARAAALRPSAVQTASETRAAACARRFFSFRALAIIRIVAVAVVVLGHSAGTGLIEDGAYRLLLVEEADGLGDERLGSELGAHHEQNLIDEAREDLRFVGEQQRRRIE